MGAWGVLAEVALSADLLAEIELGPLERWRRFGVWPLRMFVHVAVLGAVLAQVHFVSSGLGMYTSSVERTWKYLLGDVASERDVVYRSHSFFFGDEDVRWNDYVEYNATACASEAVNLVRRYYDLGRDSIDALRVYEKGSSVNNEPSDGHRPLPAPKLELSYLADDPYHRDANTDITHVSERVYSVKQVSDLLHYSSGVAASGTNPAAVTNEFFKRLLTFKLFFWFETESPHQDVLVGHSCTLWKYVFAMEHKSSGGMHVSMHRDHSRRCPSRKGWPTRPSHDSRCSDILRVVLVVVLLHMIANSLRVWKGVLVLQVLKRKCRRRDERRSRWIANVSSPRRPYVSTPRELNTGERTRRSQVVAEAAATTAVRGQNQAETISRSNNSRAIYPAVRGTLRPPRRRQSNTASGSMRVVGSKGSSTWERVPWVDKLKIINVWVLVALAGDILVGTYSVLVLFNNYRDARTSNLFEQGNESWMGSVADVMFGCGSGMVFVSLLEYVEYTLVNYLFIQVMRVAMLGVGQLLFSGLPVFGGFTLCGTILFGDFSDRFATVRVSASTLFATMLADELRATTLDITSGPDMPAIVGLVFVISFVFIMTYVASKVFLTLVENAFITQGLWLLDEAADPREAKKEKRRKKREKRRGQSQQTPSQLLQQEQDRSTEGTNQLKVNEVSSTITGVSSSSTCEPCSASRIDLGLRPSVVDASRHQGDLFERVIGRGCFDTLSDQEETKVAYHHQATAAAAAAEHMIECEDVSKSGVGSSDADDVRADGGGSSDEETSGSEDSSASSSSDSSSNSDGTGSSSGSSSSSSSHAFVGARDGSLVQSGSVEASGATSATLKQRWSSTASPDTAATSRDAVAGDAGASIARQTGLARGIGHVATYAASANDANSSTPPGSLSSATSDHGGAGIAAPTPLPARRARLSSEHRARSGVSVSMASSTARMLRNTTWQSGAARPRPSTPNPPRGRSRSRSLLADDDDDAALAVRARSADERKVRR